MARKAQLSINDSGSVCVRQTIIIDPGQFNAVEGGGPALPEQYQGSKEFREVNKFWGIVCSWC